MPPRINSRHLFTLGVRDAETPEQLQLTEREPYLFREFPDNQLHKVVEGDTLHGLAARYFAHIDSAANLFWVIADFQPEPIHDPTLALTPGTTLVIPSVRTVLENVFSNSRVTESG